MCVDGSELLLDTSDEVLGVRPGLDGPVEQAAWFHGMTTSVDERGISCGFVARHVHSVCDVRLSDDVVISEHPLTEARQASFDVAQQEWQSSLALPYSARVLTAVKGALHRWRRHAMYRPTRACRPPPPSPPASPPPPDEGSFGDSPLPPPEVRRALSMNEHAMHTTRTASFDGCDSWVHCAQWRIVIRADVCESDEAVLNLYSEADDAASMAAFDPAAGGQLSIQWGGQPGNLSNSGNILYPEIWTQMEGGLRVLKLEHLSGTFSSCNVYSLNTIETQFNFVQGMLQELWCLHQPARNDCDLAPVALAMHGLVPLGTSGNTCHAVVSLQSSETDSLGLRIADDGFAYSQDEFFDFFDGSTEWDRAMPLVAAQQPWYWWWSWW